MSTPAATEFCTASCAEWKYVPSPTFWMKWSRSTNGAIPTHWAPSEPMHVTPAMSPKRSGSINTAIVWQPIPAPISAPGGAAVERLWGHPEQ